MTNEINTTDPEGEDAPTNRPPDGLDHAIDWLKRGGGYDRMLWKRRRAFHHATSARADADEKMEEIARFRDVVKKFLLMHAFTIRRAYTNATAQYQSKNRKRNTGQSHAEVFFASFLASLESIANGDPILTIRTAEIDDWNSAATYFEMMRRVPSNASLANDLSTIQIEWDNAHDQWMRVKLLALELA